MGRWLPRYAASGYLVWSESGQSEVCNIFPQVPPSFRSAGALSPSFGMALSRPFSPSDYLRLCVSVPVSSDALVACSTLSSFPGCPVCTSFSAPGHFTWTRELARFPPKCVIFEYSCVSAALSPGPGVFALYSTVTLFPPTFRKGDLLQLFLSLLFLDALRRPYVFSCRISIFSYPRILCNGRHSLREATLSEDARWRFRRLRRFRILLRQSLRVSLRVSRKVWRLFRPLLLRLLFPSKKCASSLHLCARVIRKGVLLGTNDDGPSATSPRRDE